MRNNGSMNVLIYFVYKLTTLAQYRPSILELYGIRTDNDRYLQKISFYFLLRKWSIQNTKFTTSANTSPKDFYSHKFHNGVSKILEFYAESRLICMGEKMFRNEVIRQKMLLTSVHTLAALCKKKGWRYSCPQPGCH